MSPLSARRADLPGIFAASLRRAARRQGCVAPVLTNSADALIWRQAWPGGLHELFDLARRLVPLAHGCELDAQSLADHAQDLGWSLAPKLSTRQLDPSALWQALDSTRKKSGGFHRGRAAGLMGWDPDTLSVRLAELDLR